MAYEESLRTISLDADSSLAVYTGVPGQPGSLSPNSGNLYKFVKVTGAHQCGLATAAANEVVVGVLNNKPQVTNMAATVAIGGVSFVVAGTGGVTAADGVKVESSTGKGVTWVAGTDDPDLQVGVALGSASAGALFPCLLRLR